MAFIQAATFTGGPAEDTFAADFRGARFAGDAWFSYTTFVGRPWFHTDEFFSGAHFGGHASFKGVIFNHGARFDGASFEIDVDFTDARTRSDRSSGQDWPEHWTEASEAEPAIGGTSDEAAVRWRGLVAPGT